MTQSKVSPQFYSSEPNLEAEQMSRNSSSLRNSNLFSSPNSVAIKWQQSVGSLTGIKSLAVPTQRYPEIFAFYLKGCPFWSFRWICGEKFPAEISPRALDTPPHLGNTLGTGSSCGTASSGTQPWWQGSHHIPQQIFPVLNNPHG